MSNILTREVAGLPVGAWGAVVAGGLGIAYLLNRNQTSGPEPRAEPLTEPGVGTGLIPAGSVGDSGGSGSGQDQNTDPQTNLEWQNRAISWLIGQNNDPNIADDAVRKYLTGESLNLQENALISQVLRQFGPPPEDVPVADSPDTPDDDPSKTPGGPQLQLDFLKRVPRKTSPVFRGRVAYGATGAGIDNSGQPPGKPTLVRVDIFHSVIPGVRVSTYHTQADANGMFETRPGWANPISDTRRYGFHWNGAYKSDKVRFVKQLRFNPN